MNYFIEVWSKPRIQQSVMDEMVMGVEAFIIVALVLGAIAFVDRKRR